MTRGPHPPTIAELARQLALDELLGDRDVRPRPGPVRCDGDQRQRLRALGVRSPA